MNICWLRVVLVFVRWSAGVHETLAREERRLREDLAGLHARLGRVRAEWRALRGKGPAAPDGQTEQATGGHATGQVAPARRRQVEQAAPRTSDTEANVTVVVEAAPSDDWLASLSDADLDRLTQEEAREEDPQGPPALHEQLRQGLRRAVRAAVVRNAAQAN